MGGVRCLGLFPKKSRSILTPSLIGTWNKKGQYMNVYIVIHGLLFGWNTIDIEVYDRDDNFDSDSRQQRRVKTAHRGKR